MYGKIFASMYEGTLYGHWQAIVTMQQLLVLCDQDGVVDMTPQAIAARTSIPFEIIEKGLEILAQPDPYSRTPGEEGRRIVLLDEHRPWGWEIVNHGKYRAIVSSETKREQARERKRKERENKKNGEEVLDCMDMSHTVTLGHAPSRMSRHTDTDTNTDTNTKNPTASLLRNSASLVSDKPKKPTTVATTGKGKVIHKRGSRLPVDNLPDAWRDFCKSERPDLNPVALFAEFSDYWRAKPGKDGLKSDWEATWRNWVRREGERKNHAPSGPLCSWTGCSRGAGVEFRNGKRYCESHRQALERGETPVGR